MLQDLNILPSKLYSVLWRNVEIPVIRDWPEQRRVKIESNADESSRKIISVLTLSNDNQVTTVFFVFFFVPLFHFFCTLCRLSFVVLIRLNNEKKIPNYSSGNRNSGDRSPVQRPNTHHALLNYIASLGQVTNVFLLLGNT